MAEPVTPTEQLATSLAEKRGKIHDAEARIIALAFPGQEVPPAGSQEGSEENWKAMLVFRQTYLAAAQSLRAQPPADMDGAGVENMLSEVKNVYDDYWTKFEDMRELDPAAYHSGKAISAIYTKASAAISNGNLPASVDMGALISAMAKSLADGAKAGQADLAVGDLPGSHVWPMQGALHAMKLARHALNNAASYDDIVKIDLAWKSAQKLQGAEKETALSAVRAELEVALDEMVGTPKEQPEP